MSDSSPIASPGSPASMSSSVPRKSPDSMSSTEERNGIGAFETERGIFGQERMVFNQDRGVFGIPHLQQPTIKVLLHQAHCVTQSDMSYFEQVFYMKSFNLLVWMITIIYRLWQSL